METSPFNNSIYCILNNSELHERKKILQNIKPLIKEKTEIENGYNFKFQGDDEILQQIFEIIKMERTCCPFLNFSLIIEQEKKSILLKITGPSGTKDFLLYEFGW